MGDSENSTFLYGEIFAFFTQFWESLTDEKNSLANWWKLISHDMGENTASQNFNLDIELFLSTSCYF